MEATEEAVIMAAQESGVALPRRIDALTAAVLMLRIAAAEAKAVP